MGTGRRDLDTAGVGGVAEVRSEAEGQISGRRLKTGDGMRGFDRSGRIQPKPTPRPDLGPEYRERSGRNTWIFGRFSLPLCFFFWIVFVLGLELISDG
jgi:hypothetical protein